MEEQQHEHIICPYCGEEIEIFLEQDVAGEMVYDCEVCCNPWRLLVRSDGDQRRVEATQLDD